MGTSGSKLHRSTAGDVKDNLIWSIEELQRWEDGAAMVRCHHTAISEPWTRLRQQIAKGQRRQTELEKGRRKEDAWRRECGGESDGPLSAD